MDRKEILLKSEDDSTVVVHAFTVHRMVYRLHREGNARLFTFFKLTLLNGFEKCLIVILSYNNRFQMIENT